MTRCVAFRVDRPRRLGHRRPGDVTIGTPAAGFGQCAVEGLEHDRLPIIAIQWHPEMLATRDTDPIFRWLVAQSTRS